MIHARVFQKNNADLGRLHHDPTHHDNKSLACSALESEFPSGPPTPSLSNVVQCVVKINMVSVCLGLVDVQANFQIDQKAGDRQQNQTWSCFSPVDSVVNT